MEKVVFDIDMIEQTRQNQYVPDVFQKYQTAKSAFTASNAYSSLHGYGRCGISGFVNTMSELINSIEMEVTKIDQFIIAAGGNYRGLEYAVQEKGASENMDSESLMSSTASFVKLSELKRDYASEDSFPILQFEPTFSEPSTSSLESVSGGMNPTPMIYGSSISKAVTDEDSGYQVASVYQAKPLLSKEESTTYDPKEAVANYEAQFSTTTSTSTIDSKQESTYTQGESSI